MTATKEPTIDRSIAAAERTLAIIDALADAKDSLTLGELAEVTGLFKSVILRYMISLERSSYVRKLPGGSYQLGPRVLQLGQAYERALDRANIIGSALDRLVSATGESAFFYTRERESRLCLMGRDSPQSLRVNSKVGSLLPLDETSIGQVLREFQNPLEKDEAQQPNPLRASVGVYDPLTASLSAPVFSAADTLVGALAISGPLGRFDPADETVRRALLREACSLSGTLGGEPARKHFPPV